MDIDSERIGTTWTRGGGPELAKVKPLDPADKMRIEAKIAEGMALDAAKMGLSDVAASFDGYARGIWACLRALGHGGEQ